MWNGGTLPAESVAVDIEELRDPVVGSSSSSMEQQKRE
jgi:hypothetical protein